MMDRQLKSEIAQRELSDLGCGDHTEAFFPYIHIRFSTDREPEGGEIYRFRSDFTLSGEGGIRTHGT